MSYIHVHIVHDIHCKWGKGFVMLEYSLVAINTDMNKINMKASIYMIVY